jgi:hypothetical protein
MDLLDTKVPVITGAGSGIARVSTSMVAVVDGSVRPHALSLGEHR